jgi:hypothetical protein
MTAVSVVARWALLALGVLGLVLLLVNGTADLEVAFFLPFAAYGAVGFLLARLRPANALGWVFLAVGVLGFLLSGTSALAQERFDAGQLGLVTEGAAWFGFWSWMVLLSLATVFPLLLFPDGLPSRRWRPVLWFAVGSTVLNAAMFAFVPRLVVPEVGFDVDNPFSPRWLAWLPSNPEETPLFGVLTLTLAALVVVAAVGQVLRYRAAGEVVRMQLRWFALAAAILAVSMTMETVLESRFADSVVVGALFVGALAFVPVACGIAVLRYRLYEIDRIISRTASYALVTGLVLVVYVCVVWSVPQLLPQSSDLAVAAATLTAAALFRPLLSWVQSSVDRRFNRSRYDADRAVEAFANRLRDEVDPERVSTDLLAVVDRTVAPNQTYLWLGKSS